MLSILNLALPFFGLIFIGFACGKLKKLPDEGLAWMNFFIFYVALPALFFRILSKTPLEQLAQFDFVAATVLATASAFTIAYIIGLIARRGDLAAATVAAVAGGFGNVGYMGPGLALAAIGPDAAVPVALIFSFDALLIFTLVPLLMAVSGTTQRRHRPGAARRREGHRRSIRCCISAAARGAGGGLQLRAADGGRSPARLPLHLGRALRAVRARGHRGAAADAARALGGAAARRRQAGAAPDPRRWPCLPGSARSARCGSTPPC